METHDNGSNPIPGCHVQHVFLFPLFYPIVIVVVLKRQLLWNTSWWHWLSDIKYGGFWVMSLSWYLSHHLHIVCQWRRDTCGLTTPNKVLKRAVL